jgi:hypothetical protein
VQQLEVETRVNVQNLAIVWGPILLSCPDTGKADAEDMKLQCRVVETILSNYIRIFEPEK